MTTNGTQSQEPRYDPNFTQNVINAMGPKTSPRMKEVMTSLIRHLHDFAREVDLTVDEWSEGVALLNWAGQMSTDRRNEGQLVCDIVGLESYGARQYFDVCCILTSLLDLWTRLPIRKPPRPLISRHNRPY